MLAVLGGLADVERDLVRNGTAEGRTRAQARGQHMGRPWALTPEQQADARLRRAEGARAACSADPGKEALSTTQRRGSTWKDALVVTSDTYPEIPY